MSLLLFPLHPPLPPSLPAASPFGRRPYSVYLTIWRKTLGRAAPHFRKNMAKTRAAAGFQGLTFN
ncbi:hypothetical protein KNP414_03101 [Paenibacillus mucilaginosus KNP414]|uniref:Uncharacterized protein n=1 Tax=Paenibacillus mucilaginosus (strain KNP414) TaxID=1036673 RepID=F8FB16_PAEMK|nr:hypothetical protein KNP414_03101 [Paenibacillus mucilaginosus KNP414]